MAPKPPAVFGSRKVFRRIVSYRRILLLLCVVGALSSLVLVSSARFDERNDNNSPASNIGDKRRQPQNPALQSRVNQQETSQAGATRIDVPEVKPKRFHGDVRRLPRSGVLNRLGQKPTSWIRRHCK